MDVPSIEPVEFYAGDTISWTRRMSSFPADQGWALAYRFVNKDISRAVQQADITPDGSQFLIQIPADETAALLPATYQLIGYVTDGTDRYIVADATVRVREDPAVDGEPFDFRTQNERVLESINALIEGREDVEEHAIDGRQLRQMKMDDLIKWQQVYSGRVMREKGTLPSLIGARFQ